jgi:integration host factor subunit beta
LAIVKSKLLKKINNNYPNFLKKDLKKFTDIILNEIKLALKRGDRVELRGFWSFFNKHTKIENIKESKNWHKSGYSRKKNYSL